jgi:hypothetical protein
MSASIGLDRCLSFINCQLQPPGKTTDWCKHNWRRRAVTISRQTGSGAHVVAEKLARFLQDHIPEDACPWTVFDQNLVERVLEEHNLPRKLAGFMREDRISEASDTLDELFGLHPPSWTLVRKTAETILHLADLGQVIIIGRGASVITGKLDSVLHVRLVGSLDRRAEYIQQQHHLDPKAARAFIHREDRARAGYLKKYYGRDIEDPLLYHLVINTDRATPDEVARLIGEAVMGRVTVPA